MRSFSIVFIFLIINVCCNSQKHKSVTEAQVFNVYHDKNSGTISVFRNDDQSPVLTQNAKPDIRPYIHPIIAPDGKGVLTEFSPAHHKHQTGLYWGLKQVNGRDYFMNWKEDYWRRISAKVVEEKGPQVKWQTVYELLDENDTAILTETQN